MNDIALPTKAPKPPRDPLLVRAKRKLRLLVNMHLEAASRAKWGSLPYATIDVEYWRPGGGVNFGDELSRVIVQLMLAKSGVTIFDEVAEPRRLLAIGSILHLAHDGDVIWGSGVNGSVVENAHRYKSLSVRAVRGPHTREFLIKRGIEVPTVYGDPGLLTQRLTGSRFSRLKEHSIGIVPNLYDMHFIKENNIAGAFSDAIIIDPRRSWNAVVADICRCEFIVASSLHGLVIADSFAIPNRFVRFTEFEGLFKYRDYYEGTGRDLSVTSSIDEALSLGAVAPPVIDMDALEAAFPLDIWL